MRRTRKLQRNDASGKYFVHVVPCVARIEDAAVRTNPADRIAGPGVTVVVCISTGREHRDAGEVFR
jgi:hypothetical protein